MAGLKERFKDLSLYAPGSLSIHSNGSLKQMLKLMLPQTISGHKKMLLELFSGTGSVGKPFREAGWDVISVDLDGRFNPEIQIDIMKWDYTQCRVPEVVWASPPCILYSQARSTAKSDLAQADVLVNRTLEIISFFQNRNPKLLYFIENPDTGKLPKRPILQHLPSVVLNYCKYGFPYPKRTRIWTNSDFVPRPLCKFDCDAPKHGKAHWFTAQRGGYRFKKSGLLSPGFTQDQLHQLPPELCADIFSVCQRSGI